MVLDRTIEMSHFFNSVWSFMKCPKGFLYSASENIDKELLIFAKVGVMSTCQGQEVACETRF